MVRVGLLGYGLAGPLVGLVHQVSGLFLVLLLWGAFQGTLDVAMNTQAISVERGAGRPLMPSFHGGWSLGTLAGAALGTVAVAIGISLSLQLLLLGTGAVVGVGWLTTRLIADVPVEADAASHGARHRSALGPHHLAVLGLGAIAFADMLCEGAAADWAAVYLRDSLHTDAAVGGLGYTAYSLAMVSVRLSGNRLLARFGVERLLPALATVATVGMAGALLADRTMVVLIGFACLGAGLAAVIPTVTSAAGRIAGMNAGRAVAVVSACGWLGFVCGPALIGQIALATSLRIALALLPVLTAVIVVVTATTVRLRPRAQAAAVQSQESRRR
jgi:fucose permease